MNVIEGDPEKDFFEQNPEIRYLKDVNKFILKYGEKKTGFYMWAAYMFEDPRSKIYKVPIDERTEIVMDTFLTSKMEGSGTRDQITDELKEVRAAYPTIILTKNQILYKGYADQMDEFMVYTKALPIATHADKKVSYLEKLTKMWPTYEKIAEKMEEEESANSEVRKGVKESHREKRSSR